MLDTGATLTCIDVSLARELRLPELRAMAGVAIGAMSAGAIETVRMRGCTRSATHDQERSEE